MTSPAALLRATRERHHLSQKVLAQRAGLSPDAISSYESGRRPLTRGAWERIIEGFGLPPEEANAVLQAAGFESERNPQLLTLEQRRPAWAALQADVSTYDWPCMVNNDNFEIMAWNAAANVVAEMDIGAELPRLAQRHLLRMASLPRFREQLTNWDDVLGTLISMYKHRNEDVTDPESGSAYFAALAGELAHDYPDFFPRIVALWVAAQPIADGVHFVIPIEWRAGDGSALRFDATLGPWSDFDGAFAFDWHPADAATWRWLEANRPQVSLAASTGPAAGSDPGPNPETEAALPSWRKLLREAREACGLSRHALHERTGISEETLYSYEAGRRRPRESNLLEIARVLDLDGATANLILTGAGFAARPSHFALFVTGQRARPRAKSHLAQGRAETLASVREVASTLRWPCFIINSRCEVVAANGPAASVTEVSAPRNRPVAGRDNLLNYVTSEPFRSSVENWDEVVSAILPGSLAASIDGNESAPNDGYFRSVVEQIRRRDPQILARLIRLWRGAERRRNPQRVVFSIRSRRADGALLRFNCQLGPWDQRSPYWALDWHPADAETWNWLDTRAQGATRR